MSTESSSPIRNFLRQLDYVQLLAVFILLSIGLVFIRSTGIQVDTEVSRQAFDKQLQWITFGTAAYLVMSLIDYRQLFFRAGTIAFYCGAIVLLTAVLFIGIKIFGATRWISIAGFRLQPSEPAKLATIMMLAAIFSYKKGIINRFGPLMLGAAVTAIPLFLIAIEPDLGSAIVLVPIFFSMLFCAGLKWRYLLIALALAATVIGILTADYLREKPVFLRSYQRDRIRVFLNPDMDRTNRGHNAYQAKLAVGSGGWSGKGIGKGTQNELGFLPQTVSNNDFIFSVIAEETGFSGVLGLLAAYVLLFYSMLRTAFLAPLYGRCLAVGAAAMMFFHVFINIGMSIGLAPVTGLPLPLVSYGGSFTLTSMITLGLVQSVHRHLSEDSE